MAVEEVQEAVAEAAEFVSDEAEKFAEFARQLNKTKIQFALLGSLAGAAAGAMASFAVAYRKAEQKANDRADAEIEEMREHYENKATAIEAQAAKGGLGDLVRERGYISEDEEKPVSAAPPMAVQPPSAVVVAEDEMAGEPDDREMAVNDVEGPHGLKPPVTRNVFRDHRVPPEPLVWDQEKEEAQRRSDRSFVIHRDEVSAFREDTEVSLTYYAEDDVLCNEDNEIIDPTDRDRLVGEDNLDKFGHGSGEPSIVYIRNPDLEILYEIVKSEGSFAQDVHGIQHSGWDRGNLERFHRREREQDA